MHYGKSSMGVNGMTDKEQAHYIQVLIKHDKESTPWNDRMAYWEQYRKLLFWKDRQ